MSGTTIEARPRSSAAPVGWSLVGVVLIAVGAATRDATPGMLGVFPIVLGSILWIRRPSAVQLTLQDLDILVHQTGALIPYASIRSVTEKNVLWSGSPPTMPLVIDHSAGRLILPTRLCVQPFEFYEWLRDRVPQAPSRACPPELEAYHAAQAAKFGDQKVTTIFRRGRNRSNRMGAAGVFLLAALLTSVAWGLIVGLGPQLFRSKNERDGWITAALSFGFGGAVLGLVGVGVSSSRESRREKAGAAVIVLGPAGMAMKQGDMKGSLRWDEITGVTPSAGASQLVLAVRGARIVLQDVYEWSLNDIAAEIRRNLG